MKRQLKEIRRKVEGEPNVEDGMTATPQGIQWVTADNAKGNPGETNAQGVMKNIEYILERMDLLGAYRDAVNAAGGDACPWGEKLKIAGYVYFGGAQQPGNPPFVKKPLSIMDPMEKIDKVREIGFKKWGDITIRPYRRNLITEQTYKDWRAKLYPAPKKTAKGASSFRALCLDDRITWAHTYLSRYHSLVARSEDVEVAVLKAMEWACKSSGIPVFTGDDRKQDYIMFLVEEHSGLAKMADITAALKESEERAKPAGIRHDAETRTVDYAASLKLLMPTLKALNLIDLYREYSDLVKARVKLPERIKGERDMAIAQYLISVGPIKNGFRISAIPACLLMATDPERDTCFSNEPLPVMDSVSSARDVMWDREAVARVNRSDDAHGSLKARMEVDGYIGSSAAVGRIPDKQPDIEIQVDGKTVGHMGFMVDADKQDPEKVEDQAAKHLSPHYDTAKARKVIVVPGRLVNFVGCPKKAKAKRRNNTCIPWPPGV